MKLIFKKYIVNTETDFVEDEIDKIKVHLTVCAGIEGDTENIMPLKTYDLYIINLNSQTGEEMDSQRQSESIAFIESQK
jgi:hypothetical protein